MGLKATVESVIKMPFINLKREWSVPHFTHLNWDTVFTNLSCFQERGKEVNIQSLRGCVIKKLKQWNHQFLHAGGLVAKSFAFYWKNILWEVTVIDNSGFVSGLFFFFLLNERTESLFCFWTFLPNSFFSSKLHLWEYSEKFNKTIIAGRTIIFKPQSFCGLWLKRRYGKLAAH